MAEKNRKTIRKDSLYFKIQKSVITVKQSHSYSYKGGNTRGEITKTDTGQITQV